MSLWYFVMFGYLFSTGIFACGFLPDTLVATSEDSWQEIVAIIPGQQVFGWCGEAVRVVEKFNVEVENLICLHLDNADTLILAPEQQLLSIQAPSVCAGLHCHSDMKWLMANHIDPGVYLLALAEDSGVVKVINVEVVKLFAQRCRVMQLKLELANPFFVSKGLIVARSYT